MDAQRQKVYLAALLHDIQQYTQTPLPDWANTSDTSEAFILYALRLAGGSLSQPTSAFSKNKTVKPVLASVFQTLQANTWQLPQEPLTLQDTIFPTHSGTTQAATAQTELAKAFVEKCKQLNASNAVDGTLPLLQMYGTALPAKTTSLPDVSLFDHSKSAAAIALCLYDYIVDKKLPVEPIKEVSNHKPLLLIGGDISGIQSYIYDIVSKYAAKNLKGRSYYLQLLVDSVVERLLRDLSLPQGNIVYASGGGFYLLAPNTPQVESILEKTAQDIQDKLFAKHRTALFLSLAWQPVALATLQSGNVSSAWSELLQKLGDQKRRKFARQLVQQYDSFFDPEKVAEKGGNTQRDVITGEEIKGQKQQLSKEDSDSFVSEDTYDQIELGKDLRTSDYRIVSHQKIAGEHVYEPAGLAVWNAFVATEKGQQKGFVSSAIYAINNLEGFAKQAFGGSQQILGFELYGGNDYPVQEGSTEPLTFNALAGAPDDNEKNANVEETNFKRLGVLRMDVDNLGHAFGNGFKDDKAESRAPFSRYAALSRSLDFFFKGYLNTLWETGQTNRKESFKQHTFIIYSGGDDLFIVGRWDVLIEFAAQIHQKFALYSCNNPSLTLSGGIAVVPPKFPISKGADEAAEAEKQAKSHIFYERVDVKKTLKHEKNAFTLFGVPLNWVHEYPHVKELKDELVELKNQGAPQSLLGKIHQHYAAFMEWKKANERGEFAVERWRWQMAYDFKRLANSLRKNHTVVADAIDRYAIEAFTYDDQNNVPAANGGFQNITYLERLNLAARWAELDVRTHS